MERSENSDHLPGNRSKIDLVLLLTASDAFMRLIQSVIACLLMMTLMHKKSTDLSVSKMVMLLGLWFFVQNPARLMLYAS